MNFVGWFVLVSFFSSLVIAEHCEVSDNVACSKNPLIFGTRHLEQEIKRGRERKKERL